MADVDDADGVAPGADGGHGADGTPETAGRGWATGGAQGGWLAGLRRQSGPARFHQYNRYSIESFGLIEALLYVFWLLASRQGTSGAVAAVLAVPLAAHAVGVVVLSRQALGTYLGDREYPRRTVTVFLLVTATALLLSLTLRGAGVAGDDVLAPLCWTLMFTVGPLVLAMPVRRAAAWGALGLAVALLGAAALGAAGRGLLVLACVAGLGGAFLGVTYRLAGWSLKVVNELVAARETQARLAVAEERLRFARDMHDVLGRNLSVIALKSELAAELARRGAASAVEQMAEVQRVARDSQRELREVVRGYREADLNTELVGARGVLRAAGIDCRVADAGTGTLPPAVHTALGWVVREGVTNVLRHAQAEHCAIRLRLAPASAADANGGADTVAVLVMENDGVPEGPSSDGDHGSGLAGLRERLAALRGEVTTERLPGGTFRLTARVPLPASDTSTAAGRHGADGVAGPTAGERDGVAVDGRGGGDR